MERKLVKAGIYGLLLGLLFSIIYHPDIISLNNNGAYSGYVVPMREYMFKVLRTAIKICFASIIVAALVEYYKSLPKGEYSIKQFVLGIIKSLIIGTVLFLIVFYIIGILTHN
ncbi:hypothetical protein KZ483_11610 [Paenibacillus sp. sptzw28]|uniref:hypothetical protein n=1 Tax=Paenibacillus sp. sptzw28 TaxID=715179 RepID=UPI001C6EF95A|nr:hypothetical protein [Paenibacillus sp. sptzw28]QYR23496.1 hypothetical protein KZ483_11610 [Paenibacillus sp. sptzw28]